MLSGIIYLLVSKIENQAKQNKTINQLKVARCNGCTSYIMKILLGGSKLT